MPKKLTFEFVKNAFSDRGYVLIENHYAGKDVPMRYRCSQHIHAQLAICYNALRNGHGCPRCADDRVRSKLKLPFTVVLDAFEKAGYTLLSQENDYINAHSKMKYRCSQHPDASLSMSLSNLKAGKRCKLCSSLAAVQKLTTPLSEVRALFEGKGLIMLDEEYRGKGKIRFCCPRHPDKLNSVTLAHLKNKKHVCPYCARLKVDFEDIKKEFEERNCELLEKSYFNDRKKMRFRCLVHPTETYEISYDKFRSGQRGCHECAGFHYATYEEVKGVFQEVGYELLESGYAGADLLLSYKCPYHPDKETRMTYRKLRMGRICPYCKNPYYTGEGDVKWKGGITKINALLRQSVENWKVKALRDHNYKCVVTGNGGSLHVHHTSVPFHKLRDQVFHELRIPKRSLRHEVNTDEMEQIVGLFIKKHNDVIGVPLLQSVHLLFHSIDGHHATLDDLGAFKARYSNGEFSNVTINLNP